VIFEFRPVASLPRLAWCARLRRGEEAVRVLHGAAVETAGHWFVEGVWNGPFGEAGILDATMLLGSGGRAESTHVSFAAASHPMDRLQYLRLPDELLISNSLTFLLAQGEDGPDPDHRFYDRDIIGFVDGVSAAVRRLPTRRGRVLELLYCANLTVDRDLRVSEQRRPQPRGFTDYADYVRFLTAELAALDRNARDPGRLRSRYEPLATISTGYDSPACAVLARSIGCTRAVTVGAARPEYGGGADSGLELGRRLGLTVTEYDRAAYLRRDDLIEAEFLAVGTGGEDVVMSAFEPELRDTLFFTGFLGDTLWGRLHALRDREAADFRMRFPAGASLTEFRLRVGFVHLPVPLLTYGAQPSLHRISNSQAMRPWRVRNPHYDRPIPRRLVEEAGIPRELFGRRKRAVTQPFYHNEPLRQIMSQRSYRDFLDFCGARRPGHGSREQAVALAVLPRVHAVQSLVSRGLSFAAGWLGISFTPGAWVHRRYRQPLGENALTFHWAQDRLGPRYDVAADRLDPGAPLPVTADRAEARRLTPAASHGP
jgi:hypothetical protein